MSKAIKTTNKATNKAARKATNKAQKAALTKTKQPAVKTDKEIQAIALAVAKTTNESSSREAARKALFELIASLCTIVQVMPKAEKQGKTTALSTQAVNSYIFKEVFGYTDSTPSDETRVARTRIQIAKAVCEDYQEFASALDSVESIFKAYNEYLLNNFNTYSDMVSFAKDGRQAKTPKSENEKLLQSYTNLKNQLDKAIEENGEAAQAFIAQAIEFLNAKAATNKAKKSLNYGASKAA